MSKIKIYKRPKSENGIKIYKRPQADVVGNNAIKTESVGESVALQSDATPQLQDSQNLTPMDSLANVINEKKRLFDIQAKSIQLLSEEDKYNKNKVASYNENIKLLNSMRPTKEIDEFNKLIQKQRESSGVEPNLKAPTEEERTAKLTERPIETKIGEYLEQFVAPSAQAVKELSNLGQDVSNLVEGNRADNTLKIASGVIGLGTSVAHQVFAPVSTGFTMVTDALKQIPSIEITEDISIGGKEMAEAIDLPFRLLASAPTWGAKALDKTGIIPTDKEVAEFLGADEESVKNVASKMTDLNSLASTLLGLKIAHKGQAKITKSQMDLVDLEKAKMLGEKALKSLKKQDFKFKQEGLTPDRLDAMRDRLRDKTLSKEERAITEAQLRKYGIDPEVAIGGKVEPINRGRLITDTEKQTADLPTIEEVKKTPKEVVAKEFVSADPKSKFLVNKATKDVGEALKGKEKIPTSTILDLAGDVEGRENIEKLEGLFTKIQEHNSAIELEDLKTIKPTEVEAVEGITQEKDVTQLVEEKAEKERVKTPEELFEQGLNIEEVVKELDIKPSQQTQIVSKFNQWETKREKEKVAIEPKIEVGKKREKPTVKESLQVEDEPTIRGYKNLNKQSKDIYDNNKELISNIFDLRESQKGATPKDKAQATREAKKLAKQVPGLTFEQERSGLYNVYVSGKKTSPMQKAEPKVDIATFEDYKPRSKPEELSTMAEYISFHSDKFPSGFGKAKIDKGIEDLKNNVESNEAKVVQSVSDDFIDEINKTGSVEIPYTTTQSQPMSLVEFKEETQLRKFAEKEGVPNGEITATINRETEEIESFETDIIIKAESQSEVELQKASDELEGFFKSKVEKVEKETYEMTSDEFKKGWVKISTENVYRPQSKQRMINDAEQEAPNIHKEHIQKAISEGKTVPREVLKDYPELQPKPTTEKTEAGEQFTLGAETKPSFPTSAKFEGKVDKSEETPLFEQKEEDPDQDVLFQKADTEKDLIAIHNLSEDNLANIDKIGGLAMPSLAIAHKKRGFSSFGEISLIANKDLIDPRKSKRVEAGAADIYSARYPSTTHFPSGEKVTSLYRDMKESIGGLTRTPKLEGTNFDRDGKRGIAREDAFGLYYLEKTGKLKEKVYQESDKDIPKAKLDKFNSMFNTEESYWEYVQPKGKHYKEFERFVRKQRQELSEKYDFIDIKESLNEDGEVYQSILNTVFREYERESKRRSDPKLDVYSTLKANDFDSNGEEYKNFIDDIYDDLDVETKIFKGFTPSGSRSYVANTVENAIREMRKDKGENFFYGAGTVRGKLTPRFKSIKDIVSKKDKIISSEEFDKIRDEVNNELIEITDELRPYFNESWSMTAEDASDAIISIARSGQSRILDNLPENVRDNVVEFAQKLKNLPTEYFEAKINRAVDVSEFEGALVPEDVSKKSLEILEKNGITNIKTYKDEADRKAKLQEFDDLLFQKGTQTLSKLSKPELDKELGLVNKLLPSDVKVVLDKTIKDNDGNPVRALADIKNKTIKVNPDLADLTSLPHEISHQAIFIVEPTRANTLLKRQGWDGKGDISDFSNESLVTAHEKIAEGYELYFNDKVRFNKEFAKSEQKPLARLYEKLKQLFAKIADLFKSKGLTQEESFYRDLSDGKVKGKSFSYAGDKLFQKGETLSGIEKAQTNRIKNLNIYDNFVDLTKVNKKDIGKKSTKELFEDSPDVAKAKDLDIAEKTNSKGEKKPAIRKSGFYAKKGMETAPIRDIYKQSQSPHNMALMQDGYKRGGKFGVVYKTMWLPTMNAVNENAKLKTSLDLELKGLLKDSGFKITEENGIMLSDWLEKKRPIPNKFKKMVTDVRSFLDEKRDMANTVRRMTGKKEIGYIEDYVPHMQKADLWGEMLNNKATISDNLDFIIPNEVKNPFAFRRLQEETLKPERNFFALADRWNGAIAKDITISPAIEYLKAQNAMLKNRGLTNSAKYWDEYIRTGLVGKQHKIDAALSVGVKSRKALIKWNSMLNQAFLTGKIAWNLATQPLSLIQNTPMEAGMTNTLKSFAKIFDKGTRKFAEENSLSLNIKSTDILANAMGEGRGYGNRIYRTKIDKWNDFLSTVGTIEEKYLHELSFIAGLDKAKDLGYKGEDAIDYADLVAQRTQSMYNRQNRALILNSDITRALFPFQSFSIEMWNHVKEISTKDKGAMQLDKRERFGKLLMLIVGVSLANLFSELLTGRKKTGVGTFIPFVGGIADDMINKATGKHSGRSPITAIQLGEEVIKGGKDYIKHGNLRRLRKVGVNFGLAAFGIGGGAQINNIIDGINAGVKGSVKDVRGREMFKVTSVQDKLKAPIFGVWSTEGGIKRIKGESTGLEQEIKEIDKNLRKFKADKDPSGYKKYKKDNKVVGWLGKSNNRKTIKDILSLDKQYDKLTTQDQKLLDEAKEQMEKSRLQFRKVKIHPRLKRLLIKINKEKSKETELYKK